MRVNRRGFFASLLGAVVALVSPVTKTPVAKTLTFRRPTPFISPLGQFELVPYKIHYAKINLNEEWMSRILPNSWGFIAELGPRERWGTAYRLYRMARRENVCGYLNPPMIIERFYASKMRSA
jgi:hypothetical protein